MVSAMKDRDRERMNLVLEKRRECAVPEKAFRKAYRVKNHKVKKHMRIYIFFI